MSKKKRPLSPPIHAIVFDLGNIIVDVCYDRLMERLGIGNDHFQQIYQSSLFRDFESGQIDIPGFMVGLKAGLDLTEEQIENYQNAVLTAFPLRLKTWGVIHLLGRRYPLYLLSNTNELDFEAIDAEYGIRDHLDGVFLSYEQNALKPLKNTYEKAASLWNLNPAHTLFFDDRADNVSGALAAGWNAVQIFSEIQLINELAERDLISVYEVIY